LDSNPFGTCKERRKAAQAAGAAYSAAVKAAEDFPSAEAALRDEECRMAEAANALVAETQAAADVVQGELRGRDVKLEEQVRWRVMLLRMLGNTAVCAAG
jgi:hypothetical protein